MIKTSIDSFKFQISTTFIQFTEAGKTALLDERTTLNTVTGEIDEDEFKRISYRISDQGISSRLFVRTQKIGFDKSQKQEILEILINSKLLKGDYLKGISKDTIQTVFAYIIALGLIKMDFSTFLKHGNIVDIDIKSDLYNMDKTVSKYFLKQINKLASNKGNLTAKKDNLGLQFGFRKNNNNINSSPFLKFYHKHLELISNSKEFTESFLNKSILNETKKILRFETTIKNNHHFKKLLKQIKIENLNNNLEDVLSLSEEQLFQIQKIILKKHVNFYDKKDPSSINKDEYQNLDYIEKAILQTIEYNIQKGYDIEFIIEELLISGKNRKTNYNHKKKIINLYNQFILTDTHSKKTIISNELLKKLLE